MKCNYCGELVTIDDNGQCSNCGLPRCNPDEARECIQILTRENMIEHTPESDKLIQLRRLLRTTRDALKNKAEVWNRDAEAMEEIARDERKDFSVFDAMEVAECEERAKVFRECIADIQPLICLIDSHFIKP